MDPIELINEFYNVNSKLHTILLTHGEAVAKKAVNVAAKVKYLNPDIEFIEQAAFLHDIGIFMTDAPAIGCLGNHMYVMHGYLGKILLDKIGLHRHARVCECHVGAGLTANEIEQQKLPLPKRDMVPETIEEKIVCYADKFFSKEPDILREEKSLSDIFKNLSRYAPEQVERFNSWVTLFNDRIIE